MSNFETTHYPLSLEPLPNGWAVTSVGEVLLDIQTGFASGEHNSDGLGIPHLRPMNISSRGEINLSDLRSVAPEVSPLRLSAGDVLFNNTNSPAWVGKTAPITGSAELAFSNHMTRLRPGPGMDFRFLAAQLQYLCRSGYFQQQCKKHVNQASINADFLAVQTPFLVPPATEQRRIIAKLDGMQARTDAARDGLSQVGPLLEQFRQSVLAAAFRGDLTADWRAAHPDAEPATALLARIRAERRLRWEEAEFARRTLAGRSRGFDEKWRAAYEEPLGVDSTELPGLPANWCWASIDELTDAQRPVSYGVLKPGPFEPDGIPMLRIVDIRDQIVNAAEVHRIPTALSDQYRRTLLRGGELLISLVGTIGVVALVPAAAIGFNVHRNLGVIAFSTAVLPEYAFRYLTSDVAQRQIADFTSGANQPLFNLGDLRQLAMAVPPVAEQAAIAGRLANRLKSVADCASYIEDSRCDVHHLDQSILAKAFRGDLVPQDPADEPASVLLERIRSARAAAGKPAKGCGRARKVKAAVGAVDGGAND